MPRANIQIQRNYQSEHDERDFRDDRPRKGNSNRRVSFKPPPKNAIKGRLGEFALRSRFEDDEDMGEMVNYRESSGPRRKGSPIPKGKFGSKKLMPSPYGWYQVTVQQGQRYSKDDVIRALLAGMQPDIFIPHHWRNERHCIIFFVDDFSIAERLQKLERSVQMSDGQRLLVRVRSGYPLVTIDEAFKERMKLVMAKRYNPATRALDMSKFHADPDLKQTFCALFRTAVMSAALDIMEKNIPDLEALNLNENFISSVESFKNVSQRLPQLKILYLGDNKIPSLAHLLVLRNVPIVELVLKSNPLCQRYKDHLIYVSEVRRKFPKLVKLDGEVMPRPVFFDATEPGALPQPKASFLCDASGAEIIRQFVEQYFNIFDSGDRQPLLNAYHAQAMMSITVPPATQAGRINSFWKYNRNLRRLFNNDGGDAKTSKVKIGQLAIVSSLAEWPKTKHNSLTFSVDLTLFTPKLIAFTIAGLFKEFPEQSLNGEVRHFQRQFVIAPAGSGFCIRNELILITSASQQQIKAFNKCSNPVGSASAVAPANLQDRLRVNEPSTSAAAGIVQIPPQAMMPQVPQTAPSTIVRPGEQPSDATKLEMIRAISVLSNMNAEWSRKCLEETNWDYNHAAFVFDKLHKENKIPPEAFAK